MIRFKESSVEAEYYLLPVHNRRLKLLLTALVCFCEVELGKDVILTEVFRDPTDNLKQGGIPNSPHMYWEAVDLRSWIYTEEEIKRILSFCNQFTFRNGKKVAVYHAVKGGAPHLHLQLAK